MTRFKTIIAGAFSGIMTFFRIRFELFGGLRLAVLDPANNSISDFRRSDALMVADALRDYSSRFLTDTRIPHRIYNFVLTEFFLRTRSLFYGRHKSTSFSLV